MDDVLCHCPLTAGDTSGCGARAAPGRGPRNTCDRLAVCAPSPAVGAIDLATRCGRVGASLPYLGYPSASCDILLLWRGHRTCRPLSEDRTSNLTEHAQAQKTDDDQVDGDDVVK